MTFLQKIIDTAAHLDSFILNGTVLREAADQMADTFGNIAIVPGVNYEAHINKTTHEIIYYPIGEGPSDEIVDPFSEMHNDFKLAPPVSWW